jgi:hypothetical protein
MDGILVSCLLLILVAVGVLEWKRDDYFALAALEGDLAKVKRLLTEKPSRIRDREALFNAIFNDHSEVVSFLLYEGADPDAGIEGENSALHVAAKYATLVTIDVILKYSTNIDSCGCSKKTPLCWAVAMGRSDNVKFLLSRGADPQRVDSTIGFNAKVTTQQAYQEAKALIMEAQKAPCA